MYLGRHALQVARTDSHAQVLQELNVAYLAISSIFHARHHTASKLLVKLFSGLVNVLGTLRIHTFNMKFFFNTFYTLRHESISRAI